MNRKFFLVLIAMISLDKLDPINSVVQSERKIRENV